MRQLAEWPRNCSHSDVPLCVLAVSTSLLSTLHRSLITLSALQLGYGPRAIVLNNNQVTEADLSQHYSEWLRLQVRHQALQARYEPLPAHLASPAGTPPV